VQSVLFAKRKNSQEILHFLLSKFNLITLDKVKDGG